MIVYFVRHARAGKRTRWEGDDLLRPLDSRGVRQAEGLVDHLAGHDFQRILTSPFVRCIETVAPLAAARGLMVEREDALAEGAGSAAALRLLRSAGEGVLACVHGDLVEELLGEKLKKGATAILRLNREDVEVLDRLPAPA